MRRLLIGTLLMCFGCAGEEAPHVFEPGAARFSIQYEASLSRFFQPMLMTFHGQTDYVYYLCGQDTSLRLISADSVVKRYDLSDLFSARVPFSTREVIATYLENDTLLWVESQAGDSLYRINLTRLQADKVVSRTGQRFWISNLRDQLEINSGDNIYRLPTSSKYGTAMALFEARDGKFALLKRLGKLPGDYQNNMRFTKVELTRFSGSDYLISYHHSDSVDHYHEDEFMERIPMSSDLSRGFSGFRGDERDQSAIAQFHVMGGRYTDLLFDAKRQLFYRIFSHEEPFKGRIEGAKQWSICVFNLRFEKLHEQAFNSVDYDKMFTVLLDDRLFLSLSKWNDTIDNNVYEFQEFVLEE